MMKIRTLVGWVAICWLMAGMEGVCSADEWRLSLPGWEYEFPRDHFAHPEFKTEWWYFTGNLRAVGDAGAGKDFGYQLTFFRQGIRRDLPSGTSSRFAVRDLLFAHFAVSDLGSKNYRHFHNWSRGAFGEAGLAKPAASPGTGSNPSMERVVFIGSRAMRADGRGNFELSATEGDTSLNLSLRSLKDPVFHGENGVSQKAAGEGRASHYYSFTRLQTTGTLKIGGREYEVEGLSWYDHEWATNQLTGNQTGWDWFSIQFEDGRELMIFQIRTKDGGKDPFSSGTWIERDGTTQKIRRDDFTLEPLEWWKSPETGGNYPVRWRLRIDPLDLNVDIEARMEAQEFSHPPIAYWEGAISIRGTQAGDPVDGKGYLEMTGYAGPIVGMQAPSQSSSSNQTP